jgi:predicted ATPase
VRSPIVRLLAEEGEVASGTTPRIPEGVKEVIGRRLDRLSERCNELLSWSATIGRQFELATRLPLMPELSEDTILDVLEEALDAGVIEEVPQAVGVYRFVHAMFRETLPDEISLTRRVRRHARTFACASSPITTPAQPRLWARRR